jgi:hypothetical protein
MVFVDVPNTAQIEMRGTLHGERVENTLYFNRDTGTIDQTILDALTAFMAAEYDLAWEDVLPSAYVHSEVYGTDLTSATSFASTNTDQAGNPGALSGASLPGGTTFAISFRTANRGRSGRGRNYWPGLMEADVTGNLLSAGAADSFLAVYQRLIDSPPTGWTWGVVSRYHNGAPRSTGIFQPITNVIYTDLAVDSQRRRLAGRGT